MDFIRRLLGGGERPPGIRIEVTVGGAAYDPGDGLCYVTVGTATVPGAIYRDNHRDEADWTSGIRLEDPRTGRMLLREDRYPEPSVRQERGPWPWSACPTTQTRSVPSSTSAHTGAAPVGQAHVGGEVGPRQDMVAAVSERGKMLSDCALSQRQAGKAVQ